MGMSKWIKKEWAKTRNRLRSAPTSNDEDHEDNTNDENLDREYMRALSQFFERRANPAPAIHKSSSDTYLNRHSKETNAFFKSFHGKTSCHTRNEELIAEELKKKNIAEHEESPNNSNSSNSSNKPSQNCTNESKSDNKNTSSSVNYDKFWQGNLNSSLGQTSEVKTDEVRSSGSSPLNLQRNIDTNNLPEKDQLDISPHKDMDLYYNNLTKNDNYARLNDNKIHQNILFEKNGELGTNDLSNLLPKSNINLFPITFENVFKDMENNSFEFGTNIDFFNSVPYINFKNFKWTKSSRVSNFGHFCEWREASWNHIKIVTKRVKSHCGVKSTDLFAPELKILSNIRHPHFLILMGITFDTADNIMPIFEHFRCSLYDHLHNMLGALSLQQILKISKQICEALLVLHQYGIIHSSVSSHCILLDEDLNTAKLAGLEAAFSSKSLQSYHCDKVRHQWYQWLAPEMFETDLKSISPLVDVYSLCLVFWESCCIRVPWNNLSFEQLSDAYNIWKLGVVIPENVFPNQVYNILSKGLRVDWKQRDLCMAKLLITLKYMEKFYLTKKSIYFYQDTSDKNMDFRRYAESNTFQNENSESEDFDNSSESSYTSSSSNIPLHIPEKPCQTKSSNRSNSSFYFEKKITFIRSEPFKNGKSKNLSPSQKNIGVHEEETKILKQIPALKKIELLPDLGDIVVPQNEAEKQEVENETEKQDAEEKKSMKSADCIQQIKDLTSKNIVTDNQTMSLKPSSLNLNKEKYAIDPITGLRRITKKNENKYNFLPCNVTRSQNFHLNIKDIIKNHEMWINNLKKSVIPDGDSSYVVNTTIKPASHRNTIMIIPKEKPIGWSSENLKHVSGSPRGNAYANIPKPVRDVVVMKKILNDDLKSFFEGSLWKQEKIKCLSKMHDGVNDKSVLKDIIDGKNDVNIDKKDIATSTEILITFEKETQTLHNIEASLTEINGSNDVVKNTILFIQKLLLDLLKNIPLQKEALPNKARTISINIEDPLFTKPLIYKVTTGNITLSESNGSTENKTLESGIHGVIDENLPLNGELIRVFNSTSQTSSSDDNIQVDSLELNKTFTVRESDGSDNINNSIEKEIQFSNSFQLEILNDEEINCKNCGATIQGDLLNKSQSLPSNNTNGLQSFGTLKRCRSIPHLPEQLSEDDIYIDDDLSPESLPCHIQLSPAPVNYNYSYYNLSFDKNDKIFFEDDIICLLIDEKNESND